MQNYKNPTATVLAIYSSILINSSITDSSILSNSSVTDSSDLIAMASQLIVSTAIFMMLVMFVPEGKADGALQLLASFKS